MTSNFPPDWSWDKYWDEKGWDFAVEFRHGGEKAEAYPALVEAIEAKRDLLQSPPTTEADIFATVTRFSKIKDKAEGLARLVEDLRLQPADRARLLAVLLDIFRVFLDAVYESARASQARQTTEIWEDWRRQARRTLYGGLALVSPGSEMARALLVVIRGLDDKEQWPPDARDFRPRSPGNPTAGFTQAFRRAVAASGLRALQDRPVQNDLLKYLGVLSGDPEPDV